MDWTSFAVGVLAGAFIMCIFFAIEIIRDLNRKSDFEKGYLLGYRHGSDLKEIIVEHKNG